MPDQVARDESARNEARQDMHEAVCTERWQQSKEGLARVETGLADFRKDVGIKIDKLQKGIDERIGKVPASVIAGLMGVIGFLAERAFHI